jgi:histone-lysine N-methyltransferase SETD3
MHNFQIESILNQKLSSPKKILINSKKKLNIPKNKKFQSEDYKDKNNPYKSYDLAIDYYSKNIKKDKNNTSLIIKRAICYLAKNLYNFALKDALNSLEINKNFEKGYYIASLCYLEMYNIEMAEKYCKTKDQKLKNLIEERKKNIYNKTIKFKSYPLYINFLKELYKNNAFFPKLEIQFFSDNYRGVIAKSPIKKDEIILSIPKECLISLELVLETEYGKKIGEIMFNELTSPKHCLLSSFILFEKNNPKWKFYFDLLPKDFSNFPIFYTDDELKYLKGSPFLNQILDKKSDMKKDYLKLCEYIPLFNQFTFDEFMEARMIISSRIFGISINNNKTDVLVPYADLLNHKRPRQTQWYYDDKINSFVIQATEDILLGKEIFDSYGKKTNGRFLLNYGFAVENNDSAEYVLNIIFNDCYPLYDIKKQYLKNEKKIKIFYLNINLYESQIIELLSFLRFCMFDGDINDLLKLTHCNDKNFIYTYDSNIFGFGYIPPVNVEIEINVLKKLKILLIQALNQYPTTIEQDKKIYKEDKNISFNYKNCLLLTISEKNVIDYYIYFCEFCLDLLKVKNRKELIDKLSTNINDFQFEFYLQEALLKLIKE